MPNSLKLVKEYIGGLIMADETKREKFQRLAAKRVNAALNDIRLIGNLSGSNYDYQQTDIDKILDAIDKARLQLEYRFAEPAKSDDLSFSFDDDSDDDSNVDSGGIDDGDDDGYEVTEHNDKTG